MSKIELSDSMMDVIVKMSEGNPGATTVIMQMIAKSDWYAEVPGLMMVLNLDTIGLYGEKIWMLYKDCCNEDLTRMELVLRNWQMGELSADMVRQHLSGVRGKSFNNLKSLEELFSEDAWKDRMVVEE